ncbi:MAG TPA: response regulator [Pyrinomonadaceae bacterium]|jgi:two-component system phosphate regulon response regulator PhoB|nr:response regulator [Pyrinomonadaceae bacterium]
MSKVKEHSPAIMVVDDYADTRQVVRWMLEQKGYRVIEAADGREALAVAARERPGVILMDLAMPLLDGFETIRSIRESAELAGVRIIAVTAYDMGTARDKAALAGCDHYLSKPIDFNRLSVLLEKLLGESRRAERSNVGVA